MTRTSSLSEGTVRKGGHNDGPSQITERPAPPGAVNQRSNNPPDVILELTHAQATFMLENCFANSRLCLSMIMSIADEKIPIDEKQKKSEKIVVLQEQFRDIMRLLRKAGAREKED